MRRVSLAAHRGYMSDYPENTLLAYKEALKLDIDQIEMDVHMTKDGEIICMHDHTVDRTTDGTGYIYDKTLAEMKQLDAGCKKDQKFAGERVPTFKEFLELMKDYPWCEVNVELKDYPEDEGDRAFESCDKTIAMLEEYNMADRIYINCWSGTILMYIAKKYGGKYRLHGYYPLFLNKMGNHPREERLEFYSHLYCACLFAVDRDNLTDDWVWSSDAVRRREDFDEVHKAGCQCWVHFGWNDTLDKFKRALEYGADAFTCNDPKLAAKFLDMTGFRPYGTGKKFQK